MAMRRALATLVLLVLIGAAGEARARGMRGTDSMSAGDPAFATRLESLDGKRAVDVLESGGRPVVLVFGSYT
jgi:hypothetical protein